MHNSDVFTITFERFLSSWYQVKQNSTQNGVNLVTVKQLSHISSKLTHIDDFLKFFKNYPLI